MSGLCMIMSVALPSDTHERACFRMEDGRREMNEVTSYVTQRCALLYSRFYDFVGLPHMYWELVACVNVVMKIHESANKIGFGFVHI